MNQFEKIPISENKKESPEESPEEAKKSLEKTSKRLEAVEEELMKRHIENLVRDVLPDSSIFSREDISNILDDKEVRNLAEEIFKLENQSQTTIEEGGYTNKEKAELYRGQLASLAEKKLIELKKEKAA